MNIIGKFVSKIRQWYFHRRINREIYQKIFPHLNQMADHGYPFQTDQEMVRMHIRNNLKAGLNLRAIGATAAKMPKAEGDAFRYIVYRDLNERMEMYLEHARQREHQKQCDPELVATHAQA